VKTLTKAFVGPKLMGAVAAAVVAVSAATPAMADYRQNDKLSTGEVIAGVAILGGIAAILASDKDGYRDYDNQYDRRHNRGYDGGYRNPARNATNACIRSVEYGDRYNRKQVTDIRDIQETRYGYRIKGRVSVNDAYREQGHRGYDRGYYDRDDRRDDRYGNNRGYNEYGSGKFTCYVERGRVVDIDYSGIRGY
jgi:hypothetical protein